MPPSHAIVETRIYEIEAEMKRIGLWQATAPTHEQMQFKRAFGGDKLSFEQWLQFVFIPRVQQIIALRGEFPNHSQVAGQALREWKMWGDLPDSDGLIELLRKFDAMFG